MVPVRSSIGVPPERVDPASRRIGSEAHGIVPGYAHPGAMTTAVLFPGQGSQFAGMADPWTSHPAGRDVLEEASSVMGRDVVAGAHDEAALATTEFVQPALLACDVAAYRVLEVAGVRAGAAAGHSLGEFAALVAAGVLGLRDALEAVVVRGRAMQAAADAGAGTMMALIGAGRDDAGSIADAARGGDVLAVANENASNQTVLSGSPAAIERAEAEAKSRGLRAMRLNVAGAFHSELMRPAVEPIRRSLASIPFSDARFPVAANVTAELTSDGETFRELLGRHVVSTVRWERSMRALAEAGFDTFVEAGPGQVLSRIVRRDLPGVRTVAIGSPEDAAAFARSGSRI
jgi:[acyl-carrier-protein] S-malonyltransferase